MSIELIVSLTGRLLSNDVGFTADHPIRRFLDAQGDLNNVLQFAAEDCQKHFEHDEAYALYMAAKIHAKALGIINIQVSDRPLCIIQCLG